MRACSFSQIGGPEVLEVVDAPLPSPGPGQIRVKVAAAGVNPADWKFRRGLMPGPLPRRVGLEFAGDIDAIGDGVEDAVVGAAVFGFAIGGAAAEYTLAEHWAPVPSGLDAVTAAGLPVAVETAVRSLDLVGVDSQSMLVVNGASGAVGQSIVQLARIRGARVIGTASEANHARLRELGAEPVTYGDGLVDRVRALGGSAVDCAIDAAGGGALADLVELAGDASRVVTIADFEAAQKLGVTFTGGNSAFHALGDIGPLIEAGRFNLPVEQTFALDAAGDAQALSERGHMRGKIVITI